MAEPAPYDDPMSLYESDPHRRVQRWMQGIWRGRGTVEPNFWRLYFVVLIDGRPVGMQDLIGDRFATHGTVITFSWLAATARQRGLGREMREAVLHLAFDGFDAQEATSEAFLDNRGSNGVSRALGYQENGIVWATRQNEPARMQRWLLTRDTWQHRRRDDIVLTGVRACRELIGIETVDVQPKWPGRNPQLDPDQPTMNSVGHVCSVLARRGWNRDSAPPRMYQ